MESHTVIGKLLKSIYRTYEQGYEGEDPSDNQSIYDRFYITTQNINIPGKSFVLKERVYILYTIKIVGNTYLKMELWI